MTIGDDNGNEIQAKAQNQAHQEGGFARQGQGAGCEAEEERAEEGGGRGSSTVRSIAKAVKPAAKSAKADGAANGLPKPSSKPWGQAGKALDGVKVLDFTHVQSGPTCTQLLGYMGADCIKVERPGVGDITRGQLRDVKGQDSLYFTMLNGNKRSITINSKHPKGKEILERLIKHCDVLVENFAPGALDRMGLTWELHPQDQPAHDRRVGEGFRPRSLRGLQGL